MKKSFVLFALFFLFSCKQKTDEKKDEKNIEGQNKSSEGLSGQYKVKIDDIQTLEQLEKEGFSLSTLVFGQAQSHNQNLYKNNAYRSMADVLIDDLKKRFAQDPYMSIT